MTFIQRLTELLKEKKLTRKEFLEDMHFGKNQFTYWEKNNSVPNASTLHAIASYFNVTVEYLTGESDTRETLPDNLSSLTDQEKTLITIFREASEEDRLIMITAFMNIKNGSQQPHRIYRAARSEDDTDPTVETRTASDINKLKNAATVTSDDEI